MSAPPASATLRASHTTRAQVASAADPIIHHKAPRTVFGAALARATIIAALAKAPTITPAMSRVRRSTLAPRAPARLTARATNTAATPPANAARVITGSRVTPRVKAGTSPTAAPPETPSRYGSASEFRNAPWSTAPLAPRPAPTSAPSRTRGSLRSRTIAMAVGSPVPLSASNTTRSESWTAPRVTAIVAMTIRIATSAGQYTGRNRVKATRPDEGVRRVIRQLLRDERKAGRRDPYPRLVP